MTSEANKALAHRFHMDIFQEGKLEVADEILSKDFVWRNPGFSPEMKPLRGSEGVKQMANAIRSAFPDMKITHHEEIAEGDKVLIRWSMTGTQKQDALGKPASNIQETVTGFDYFRISNGKIVEMWQYFGFGSWP
jgi:steroid delta-isomerase-like uncharacterized protein